MSRTFIVTIDEHQEIDLAERAEATGMPPTQLIAYAIQKELFATPVVVEKEPETK